MKFILFLVALICNQFIYSQQQTIRVSYVNFNDTIVPTDKRYINTLLISSDRSVSYKLPFIMRGPGMYLVSKDGNNSKYEFYGDTDSVKIYVHKDFVDELLYFQSEYSYVIRKSKTYSDSLHPFKWEIQNEEKKIGNGICRKAQMKFRGRNYTAWYDETVSISNGPWKFGGLPGLILEIYDETLTVYWTLKMIETNVEEKLPEFPINVTENFSHFKKYYQEQFTKIQKSFESSDALSDPNCKSCIGSKKTITSNTIENLANNY